MDRPPEGKMGTVSFMAVVERGEFIGGGLEWYFLVMGSTKNMEEINGKLPRQHNMTMRQNFQDKHTVFIIPTNWVLLNNQSTFF